MVSQGSLYCAFLHLRLANLPQCQTLHMCVLFALWLIMRAGRFPSRNVKPERASKPCGC